MLKGIIHCHSKYSFDSIISMSGIIKIIKKHQLDFVILTDHNTIQGAVALRRALKQHGLQHVQVPISAEYYTEYGDVIAAFITEELDCSQSFSNFVDQVKSQGGIILFPHPYNGHCNIMEIAYQSDLIEVFNSRQLQSRDKKSKCLQEKLEKPFYYSSDAHLLCEFDNVIVQIDHDSNDLKDCLLNGKITPLVKKKARKIDVLVSQFIKSLKLLRIKLFIKVMMSVAKNLILISLFKRINSK